MNNMKIAIISALLFLSPVSSFGFSTNISSSQIQIGFSPEGTARTLVLDVIGSAKNQILLMGYSFTSPEIVKSLITAKRNSIDVKVVLDKKANTGRSNVTAMNLLTNAGISVRLSESYQAQHDKIIIVDERHIQTGSYNYSAAAARFNSENVLVLWNSPELAQQYIKHWHSRWQKGIEIPANMVKK